MPHAQHAIDPFVSTGLFWSIPRLYARYAFLRKLKENVSFRLLYYPYWALRCSVHILWKLFGTKYNEQLRIIDARTAHSSKLLSYPEVSLEHVHWYEQPSLSGYTLAQIQRVQKECLEVQVHATSALIDKKAAIERGMTDTLKAMKTFYNRPLGIMAQISVRPVAIEFLYKPFWVMQSKQHKERLFLFDATTGLGGTSEYWNILDYVYALHQEQ